MKRLSILLALIASALMFISTARAATIDTMLEGKLPAAYPVFCPDSEQEWNNDPYGGAGVLGYTYMEGPHAREIHLSYLTCVGLRNGPSDAAFAIAAHTLYHEWIHAWSLDRSASAEGDAECISLFFYRYVLRHYWGVSAAKAWADYKQVFKEHALLGLEFPQYMGTCTFPQPDPVP